MAALAQLMKVVGFNLANFALDGLGSLCNPVTTDLVAGKLGSGDKHLGYNGRGQK